MRRILNICLICLCIPSLIQAQSLRGLQENPVIKEKISKTPVRKLVLQSAPVLTLPFFEDFSTSSVFPDPLKWSNNTVFINNSFGKDPVSIGVATLDAIDEYGNVHSLSNQPSPSDSLTSLPFDLSVYAGTTDTVRLSFFYQSGGKGEVPEFSDLLMLQFYNPTGTNWTTVWSASVDSFTEFQQVILKVDPVYYQNGFRFQFTNLTSMSPSEVNGGEGALSNADCWNIDYIMMNTDLASHHDSINDIALTEIPRNLIDLYESIPWSHVNPKAQNYVAQNNINYDIRIFRPIYEYNPFTQKNEVNVTRGYYLRDLSTGLKEGNELSENNMPVDSLYHWYDNFQVTITGPENGVDEKEATYEAVSYLSLNSAQFLGNDTAKKILHFKDSYVYDDGTPEYGFGIEGPATEGALLAVKFLVFRTDTLRAIDLYFNRVRNNVTDSLKFNLCVWNDDHGKPGDLIYMSSRTYSPRFYSNGPARYVLYPEQPLLISDSLIYVGWKQESDQFINLGYDVNRNNLSRTYVNISGAWFNPGGSIIPGSVMIRAVFGDADVTTGIDEPVENQSMVSIFPNPAHDMLYINAPEKEFTQIAVVDLTGRTILHTGGETRQISLTSFNPGLYHIILYSKNRKPFIQKFMVTR